MSTRDTTVIVSIYQHFKTDTMNAFTDGVQAYEEGGVEERCSQVSYKLVTCCQLYGSNLIVLLNGTICAHVFALRV